MQVSKWGNSLAVRIPADVAKTLGLKEGDQIELHARDAGSFEIARDAKRERLMEALKKFEGRLPADYKFDREEANAR